MSLNGSTIASNDMEHPTMDLNNYVQKMKFTWAKETNASDNSGSRWSAIVYVEGTPYTSAGEFNTKAAAIACASRNALISLGVEPYKSDSVGSP
ncbi:hypothetical protein FRB95_012693 [Tulasnella sp. JGI-2019a]|nr:hypothetical protein FRB95_012693 [Tulasnella sp. JGI-2019a]